MERYPTNSQIQEKVDAVNHLFNWDIKVVGSRDYPWSFEGKPLLWLSSMTKSQAFAFLSAIYAMGTRFNCKDANNET